MLKNHDSIFITIEGIEGAGKSTCVNTISKILEEQSIPYIKTREPGGTPIAEAIRDVLLTHHEEEMSIDTELLLFFAGRAQHIASVIEPALAKGKWVICDRFTDATYAYQGEGRGIPTARINQLEQWVLGELHPNHTFLLDLPTSVGIERIQEREGLDRIEVEHAAFFDRIRAGYLNRARQNPKRYTIIDASKTLRTVQKNIASSLESLCESWERL